MLSVDELKQEVAEGRIDTVVVAFTDMQGRLMGKRVHAQYFVDENIAEHGVEGCNYLLALDMEMDPIPGYSIASWEQGYGDFAMRPDLDTLRRIPWLEGTALVLCDVTWNDGSPVRPSPRQVLKAQVERAQAAGYEPMIGSELEFYLLKESFEEAHAKYYRDLTPSVPYILDYHVLATTYDSRCFARFGTGCTARASRSRARKARPGRDSRRSTSVLPKPSPWRTTIRSTRTAPRRSRT
jgi:glutamine synthetase